MNGINFEPQTLGSKENVASLFSIQHTWNVSYILKSINTVYFNVVF